MIGYWLVEMGSDCFKMQGRTELVRAFVFFVPLRFISFASVVRSLNLRAGTDDFRGSGSKLSVW
jgi:hypothetical protein